jgi:hypothetical protein
MEIQLEGVSFAPLSFIMEQNWKIEENEMKTKFKLVVKESGTYTADSFTELIWIVLKHRCQHLLKGEGWHD